MTFRPRMAAIALAVGLGSTLMIAAPASAAARCDGTQVRTCVNIFHDV